MVSPRVLSVLAGGGERATRPLDDDGGGPMARVHALGDVLVLDELRQEASDKGVARACFYLFWGVHKEGGMSIDFGTIRDTGRRGVKGGCGHRQYMAERGSRWSKGDKQGRRGDKYFVHRKSLHQNVFHLATPVYWHTRCSRLAVLV